MDTKKIRRPGFSCAGIGLVIFSAFLLAYFVLWVWGAILVVSDPLQKADAVIVLSGGDGARVNETARLYQDKYSEIIIITETGGKATPTLRSSSELKRLLANRGVPYSAMQTTAGISTSTYDEARNSLELLQSRGITSVIVVTDPYHSFRARLIFNDQFKGTDIRVMVRAAPDHWYRSMGWMFSREGWRVTVSETVKIFSYLAGFKGG